MSKPEMSVSQWSARLENLGEKQKKVSREKWERQKEEKMEIDKEIDDIL